MLIEKEKVNLESLKNDIQMTTYIRKVEADTKEEAIGKFIVDTSAVKFLRRVEPVNCFPFESLKTI